jgi:hypothetical protein
MHKGVSTRLAKHVRELRDVVTADIMNQDYSRDIASFHRNKGVFLTDAIKGAEACDVVIPDVCTTLIHDLYNYFARSARRKKALRDSIAVENRRNKEEKRRREEEGRITPPAIEQKNPADALQVVLTTKREQRWTIQSC